MLQWVLCRAGRQTLGGSLGLQFHCSCWRQEEEDLCFQKEKLFLSFLPSHVRKGSPSSSHVPWGEQRNGGEVSLIPGPPCNRILWAGLWWQPWNLCSWVWLGGKIDLIYPDLFYPHLYMLRRIILRNMWVHKKVLILGWKWVPISCFILHQMLVDPATIKCMLNLWWLLLTRPLIWKLFQIGRFRVSTKNESQVKWDPDETWNVHLREMSKFMISRCLVTFSDKILFSVYSWKWKMINISIRYLQKNNWFFILKISKVLVSFHNQLKCRVS